MKKNIVIIYGSRSTEHDISILSALQIYNAIDKQKYNVDLIYVSHNFKWYTGKKLRDLSTYKEFDTKGLKEVAILPSSQYLYIKNMLGFRQYKKIDCAILSLHGKNGEDGTIQGLLELSQIPYTSSGVVGSSVGLDKNIMKQVFLQNKIPITKYVELCKSDFDSKNYNIQKIIKKVELPVIVKPNSLGSSIGISVCRTIDELIDGIKLAFLFDEKVLIEKLVQNLKEVNISVLGDGKDCIVSATEEVQNKGEFLTFEKKYLSSNFPNKTQNKVKNNQKNSKIEAKNSNFATKSKKELEFLTNKVDSETQNNKSSGTKNGMQNLDRIIPANITKTQKKLIENLAKKIFIATNSKGVVRIDFMIDTKTQKVYANEINTIPGSFAFYLWEKCGITFDKLADRLIEIASNRNKEQEKLISNFDSSVLNQGVAVKK